MAPAMPPDREWRTAFARPASALRRLARSRTPGTVVVVAATALAAYVSARSALELGPFSGADTLIPWWALGLAFALAELCAIRLELRRQSHTFTLSGVPLVVGLLAAAPGALLVGRVLGTAVRLVHERRRPLRIVFGLSVAVLETAVAVLVFQAVAAGSAMFGRAAILGVLVSTIAGALVAVLACYALDAIPDRDFDSRPLAAAAAIAIGITAATTSITVVVLDSISSRATVALLLVVPGLAVLVAYRAVVRLRSRLRRLEFLREAGSLLARSPALDRGLQDVLALTRDMIDADVAEVVLASPDNAARALRVLSGPGDARATLEEVDLSDDHLTTRVVRETRVLALRRRDAGDVLDAHVPDCTLRDALVVPLPGKKVALGTLLVGNLRRAGRPFSDTDTALLESLAGQLGSELENARLGQTLGRLTELSEELERQAFRDPLTGLANRALFTEKLDDAVGRQAMNGGLVAVLFVDIDDFKAVNDHRGHEAGDDLLVAVAGRLRGCIRDVDTCARLGGDEFAILLEGFASDYDAEIVAERVISAFRQPFRGVGGETIAVSASVGVAVADAPTDGTGILSDADVAMYRAKAQGKATFTLFEPAMRAELFRPIEVRSNLRLALKNEEFALHYQPIVSLRSGALVGAEALVRWQSAEKGMVAPSEFIPIAEESGLIEELGGWVLREACGQARRWCGVRSDPPIWVTVNISRRQLESAAFVDVVTEALEKSRLDSRLLVLEITESVAAFDDATVLASLTALKALGVRLALDDFGSGYSSIGLLQQLPLDVLKLDRQFIESVGTDGRATQLTQTIVDLARTFGLETIAEGVERPEQVDLLVSLGCDLAQGFHFAKPLEPSGIEALLNQHDTGRWPGADDRAEQDPPRLRALDGGRRSA